ncbi:hypothetical protein ACWD25_17510 [Streptomyces sp. NPDC002920]
MSQHSYAVNALIEFPVNGSTGRATRSGHIDTALPATEGEIRGAIAAVEAEKFGCRSDQIKFVEFTFTKLP